MTAPFDAMVDESRDPDFEDYVDYDEDGICFDCGEPEGSCAECEADANCGEYGPHVGGGCALAGSEQCDECPHYNRVVLGKKR